MVTRGWGLVSSVGCSLLKDGALLLCSLEGLMLCLQAMEGLEEEKGVRGKLTF